MERAYHLMEEARKIMASLAVEASGKENEVQLARRPDVPLVGRSQALTPICKLHKVRTNIQFLQQNGGHKLFFSARA